MDILSEMQAEVYLGNGDLTFTGQSLPFDEGAIGDFNGDGFLDVARGGDLWINDGNSNNYLMIGLVGVESNLNGIGARITIEGDWGTQMKELRSGQGFQHMSSLNVHFGLGAATTVETITINWPNGTVDVFEDVDANQTVVYTQGESVVLSLTDVSANAVNIYPNPTASELNFSMAGMEGTAVSVVDVNGKVVMNTNISASNSIDVTRLQSGVYFVQFEIENEAQSIKFIKK
jgi:hypothetical protein